jgi:DNA-binding XRE family transcriptional regulator
MPSGVYDRSNIIYKRKSLEERFWSKVNIKGVEDCWEWTGTKIFNGYGKIIIDNKMKLAHRVAWELDRGRKVPKDKIIRHWKCDNPPCCNPIHLRLGTHKDNINDKVCKNRQAKGEVIIQSKLIEIEIIRIRRYWNTGDYTQQSLADFYGVNQQQISKIVNDKSWKHI